MELDSFKPCWFFPEKYVINEYGVVYNTIANQFPKTRINSWGYEGVPLNYKGKGTTQYIHRLVALTYIPNPNNYPEVNHLDGNKKNNHVSNLEWTTSSRNQKHAFEKGLQKPQKGVKNGMAKHKEEDVIRVCDMLLKGHGNAQIRDITGYSLSFIEKIKYGDRWVHITKNYGIIPKQ